MALAIKNKYNLIYPIILLVVILLWIINSYPLKGDLIMTPSSHKNIEWLSVEGKELGNNKVKFAVFDNDCNYYQIGISMSNDDNNLFTDANNIKINVDGREITSYSKIINSTNLSKYLMLLIESPKVEELNIYYKDDEIIVRSMN